ncbi:MAG: FtsW/RodA/SpoVE family cell cycle protein [Clostridia bacterium]
MNINELITNILTSNLNAYFMLLLRMITPIVALFIVWTAFTTFRKGVRSKNPVLMLTEEITGASFPVLYWENSIGRSKSCDIVLPDTTVSRDHAVLLRRDEGWFVTDTQSKAGIKVNSRNIEGRKLVGIDDKITIGQSVLTIRNAQIPEEKKSFFKGFTNSSTSPVTLLLLINIVHFSMCFQLAFGTGEFLAYPFAIFAGMVSISWLFYFTTTVILNRKTFELENIALLLSGIGIVLLSAHDFDQIISQFMAMVIGIIIFTALIAFMAKSDRVTSWHIAFAVLAILIFVANFVFGTEINGSKNWIYIGSFSVQPSEFVKILFVLVGASTLDKLQTKTNIGAFILFASVCLGSLFAMRDFGTACIYFAGFLVLAFMRSGSVRTIALILAVAVLGVVMIIYFKPYVAQRFAGWGNIWDHINDSLGYQQVRTLTYIASGGLFGMGLGNGYLHYIAAAESDLVFGLLCEEQGLLMGFVVVLALALLVFFTMSHVRRSRSAFYSIASCAAAGILVFQSCLNIFGSTDILPLTGVTLPFISLGGSSMMAVWGLLAFLKASDERTYALKRKKKVNE